jgi:hypothetical protein
MRGSSGEDKRSRAHLTRKRVWATDKAAATCQPRYQALIANPLSVAWGSEPLGAIWWAKKQGAHRALIATAQAKDPATKADALPAEPPHLGKMRMTSRKFDTEHCDTRLVSDSQHPTERSPRL